MLSLCCFLLHIAISRANSPLFPHNLPIFINNHVLVDKMSMYPHEKYTLQQENNLRFEIEWISLHQDCHMAQTLLSRPSSLNINADKLAIQFQCHHRQCRMVGPRFLAAQAELKMDGMPMQGQYKTQIWEAYSQPKLREYKKRHFQWQQDVPETIDWSALKLTLQNFQTQRSIIHKHVFNLSPTGH